MRVFGILTKWLFVLCLPALLLAAGIGLGANSLWLYKYGFNKYSVGQTAGLADAELENVARGLISYFNSSEEHISLTVTKDSQPFEIFNQREVLHLKDVKGLIRLDYRLFFGTLLYCLAYLGVSLWQKRGRRVARGVIIGSLMTFALMLALGIGLLLDFDQLFLKFHLLSFTNELWLLDPTRDYLIMLFPQGFFYDAAFVCGGITLALAAILGGAGGGYLRSSRKETQDLP